MNYTLHQLSIFCKVVEKKSITKAAEELYMTQPAVSIQIKNFQDQFDIPLTEVIGRQLYITDFGKEIHNIAERILNEANTIHYISKRYQGILAGKLKIASVSTGKYVMPYFLSNFIQSYPGIDLSLDVTNKSKVIQSLINNEIDFALVSQLPDNIHVNEEKLLKNDLFLVGNKPIEYEYTDNHLLENIPLIFREPGSATRNIMEHFLFKKGIKGGKKIELTSNEAVKQAVIAGLGYSIMPFIGLRNELKNNQLYIIPIKGLPISSEWRLIWLPNKQMSQVALRYIEYLKEQKNEIIELNFNWINSII